VRASRRGVRLGGRRGPHAAPRVRAAGAVGARLEALTEEERVVIYRRARKHGRMEDVVIRAELVCCGGARSAARDALAMSPEEPALVSLGGPAEGGGP